jgi:hypothetical protein
MSFTLHDLGSENYELSANVWSWKAALEIVKSLDILSEGKIRQMGYNATGVTIEVDDAHAIGEALMHSIIPKLRADGRMFADLRITEEPDDMTLHRDDDEQWKNFSVTREWLSEFAEFCIRSKGFQIF